MYAHAQCRKHFFPFGILFSVLITSGISCFDCCQSEKLSTIFTRSFWGKDKILNIWFLIKGRHLAKAKNSQVFNGGWGTPAIFCLCEMPAFNYKSNFMDFIFLAEWKNMLYLSREKSVGIWKSLPFLDVTHLFGVSMVSSKEFMMTWNRKILHLP